MIVPEDECVRCTFHGRATRTPNTAPLTTSILSDQPTYPNRRLDAHVAEAAKRTHQTTSKEEFYHLSVSFPTCIVYSMPRLSNLGSIVCNILLPPSPLIKFNSKKKIARQVQH